MKKVLIVDDDIAVTNYFMVFLMQTELFEPTIINDSREVAGLLDTEHFDVVMLDLDMPNVTGMEIIKLMRARGVTWPVVILTGVSDVELAVRAMKEGAFDYLTKPVDDDHLLEVLNNAMEHGALQSSLEQLPEELEQSDLDNRAAFKHLPTQDSAMIRLLHQAEQLAQGDLTVFVHGERGTGKSWLARAIHNASARAQEPFIVLDCTAYLPEEFSARLFGRAKDWSGRAPEITGSLEAASGGTLFINNIEHMSLPVQMRLKKVIQTNTFYQDNSAETLSCDVRFVVASTHDLTSTKFDDTFSNDLLYHLIQNSIYIPPLRERIDDLPMIAGQLLADKCRQEGKQINGLDDDLMDLLRQYRFPGNVMELKKLIGSCVTNTEGNTLTADSLSAYSRERITLGGIETQFVPRRLRDVIVARVRKTVDYCSGDMEQAAKLLDISEEELESYL